MAKVIALNGNIGAPGALRVVNEFFSVSEDGGISYTQKGVSHFGPMFREHDIDIRRIQNEDDHQVALDICATESLEAISERASIGDLEAKLLQAVMSGPDNEDALALQKQLHARRHLSLVQ